MDPELTSFLDGLEAFGRQHDATKADRLDRMRNLERETAQVLAVVVRAMGVQRLLELGTSNGYSTCWLADAVRSVGGRMVSVDLDPDRSAMARQNLERAGLEAWVELRVQSGP